VQALVVGSESLCIISLWFSLGYVYQEACDSRYSQYSSYFFQTKKDLLRSQGVELANLKKERTTTERTSDWLSKDNQLRKQA